MVVVLLLFLLLSDQRLGRVGVLPFYASLHVFQFAFLSGQDVSVLGAILAQGDFGWDVDLAVARRLLVLGFSTPALGTSRSATLFVAQRWRRRETH